MLCGESDGHPAPYFYPNHIMAVSFMQFTLGSEFISFLKIILNATKKPHKLSACQYRCMKNNL